MTALLNQMNMSCAQRRETLDCEPTLMQNRITIYSALFSILYFFSQAFNFAPLGFRCAPFRMAFFAAL